MPSSATAKYDGIEYQTPANTFAAFASTHPDTNRPPSSLGDPGLACILSQLGRVNAQIRYHDYFKTQVLDTEEQYKRELAASLATSLVSSSPNIGNEMATNHDTGVNRKQDANTNSQSDQWVKCYDDEVGSEYYYNLQTGEASWVDPRHS